MNSNKIAFWQIVTALFFAGAILLSSYILGGTQYEQNSNTVNYLLIALWFIPFSWLAGKTQKRLTVKEEFQCMKQKLSGLFN